MQLRIGKYFLSKVSEILDISSILIIIEMKCIRFRKYICFEIVQTYYLYKILVNEVLNIHKPGSRNLFIREQLPAFPVYASLSFCIMSNNTFYPKMNSYHCQYHCYIDIIVIDSSVIYKIVIT